MSIDEMKERAACKAFLKKPMPDPLPFGELLESVWLAAKREAAAEIAALKAEIAALTEHADQTGQMLGRAVKVIGGLEADAHAAEKKGMLRAAKVCEKHLTKQAAFGWVFGAAIRAEAQKL